MNPNNVPNYYFEFGCDFRIFLQSLDASRKPSRKNLFKVSELMLNTGHYGETMSWQQFNELYDEYAQIQINGKTNQDNSDCWFEMMVTFPRRKAFSYAFRGFSLYSTHFIEDFDEMTAIINKCFELTVKNS